VAIQSDPDQRLHRLLKRAFGQAIRRNERGTWTTTSSLPHEIRLHREAGIDLVRVSAGALVGTRQTRALLAAVNLLNVQRAVSRRIVVDGKVLVVAEMPVRSLRTGDLEHLVSSVFCCARLDAPLLALHGGTPGTALQPRDWDAELESWQELYQTSGTATDRELAVWIDELTDSNCWLDGDDSSVTVVFGTTGTIFDFPFTLAELRQGVEEFDPDDEEHEFLDQDDD